MPTRTVNYCNIEPLDLLAGAAGIEPANEFCYRCVKPEIRSCFIFRTSLTCVYHSATLPRLSFQAVEFLLTPEYFLPAFTTFSLCPNSFNTHCLASFICVSGLRGYEVNRTLIGFTVLLYL